MTADEGKKLLCDCMRVMFYRDKKAADTVQFVTITSAGVNMDEPLSLIHISSPRD